MSEFCYKAMDEAIVCKYDYRLLNIDVDLRQPAREVKSTWQKAFGSE